MQNPSPVGDIAALVTNTKASAPASPATFAAPLSWSELDSLVIPPTEWLYTKFLPFPGLMALSGVPGSYKTFFALWLAMRLSLGKRLFDDFLTTSGVGDIPEPIRQVPVLFLEEENTIQLIKERVFGFQRGALPTPNMFFAVECGFKVRNPEARDYLLAFIAEHKIKLVVMDPFSSVMGLDNENDNAEVSGVMDILRHEFVKAGVSVLFIHHPSKSAEGGKNLRGAGDILGKVDVHVALEVSDDDPKLISVSYEKMRVMDSTLLSDFNMRLEADPDGRNMRFRYDGKLIEKFMAERDELRLEILAAFVVGEEVSQKTIAERVGSNEKGSQFRNVWIALVEAKQILTVGRYKFKLGQG